MTDIRIPTLARRRGVWVALAVFVVLAVVALTLLQPWKLWIDETVDEPLGAGTAAQGNIAGATVLAKGTFISHEHDTTGTASIVQAADGTRHLRLADLDTSNGPALKVWLTDAPVIPGIDGWRVFDDGRHLDLGDLKGNKGSQNYELPADADLATYRSVSIWCERFRVSFGAVELSRP
uniref:DM13 domain-containing protein n=1 Tax=Paractinoplanes polyasparticus TaxID=2856853 RepID=UPI001C855255|nr:DM13 domain-containing protein [Actinoplanes polyasparticus]